MQMTRQRKAIIEELASLKTHPTADELYYRLKKKMPHLSLGTVYRNLELLAAKGMILKISQSGGQMRFDGFVEPHYHMRCTECGRFFDLPIKRISEIDKIIGRCKEMKVTGYELVFTGICNQCK